MKKKHRNSQKRIYFEDAEYFITSNTFNWYPYFKEKIFCDLFVENLKLCKKLKGFVLYAWVLIWDHFHLLLRPSDEFGISKIMQFLKRNISRNINYIMGYHKNDEYYKSDKFITEGGIDQSRLRMGIIHEFVVKKCILKFRFKIKYLNKNPYPRFKWHESFNDHYIRNENDFNHHWNYIKTNPFKHGLSDNWKYVFTNPQYENLIDEWYY